MILEFGGHTLFVGLGSIVVEDLLSSLNLLAGNERESVCSWLPSNSSVRLVV